ASSRLANRAGVSEGPRSRFAPGSCADRPAGFGRRGCLSRPRDRPCPGWGRRVLGGTAQGELQIQVSCEGLLRPQAADPRPEGGPRDFGPGESHFLREFVEVLDFILVHADLEILHMTM